MQFTVPQKPLAVALAKAATAASTNGNTMPILTHVHLTATQSGNLLISATDLELGYSTVVDNLDWEDPPLRDLNICVPAKKLSECVKALPDSTVTFAYTLDTMRLTISAGTASFTLVGLDPLDFPAIPASEGQQFDLDAAALVQILHATAYAQSKDETKYNLCGISLMVEENTEGDLFLTASATDGHRLVLDTIPLPGEPREIPADLKKGVIIGSKGVAALGKINPTGILCFCISGNHLEITAADEIFYIRLVDGTFPSVDKVMPKTFTGKIEVKRQALIDALERCRILSDGKSRKTRFGIGEGAIAISSSHIELGEAADQVTASVNCEPFDINFNADYLIAALEHLESGVVELSVNNDLGPVMISRLGCDFPQAIIMPQRL